MENPAATVLNIDCAFQKDPGYAYEQERTERAGAVWRLERARTEDEIIHIARDANVILLEYGNTPLTARVLQNLPRCWGLVKYGIGLDNVDLEAATGQGIVVANAAEFCLEEVSDHAIALLLSAARRIVSMDRTIRAGGWFDFPQYGSMRRIRSLTLGLLGFGRIGRAVARKMAGFGLRILASDPYATPESMPPHVTLVSREELLASADLLSIHVPLTKDTRGVIGETELRSMKTSAILVNTSRGPVIDEPALERALIEGWIAAAALDVYVEEPLPAQSPLRGMDNVILTPHYSGRSEDSMIDLRGTIADSVEAFVQGCWPPYVANPTVSPRIPLKPWSEFQRSNQESKTV
ncbi:MAG: C-terminal binding protein [Bryobacteraceae bacterium]